MSVQDSVRVLRILWVGLREYTAYRQFMRLTPELRLNHQYIPQRFVSDVLRLGPNILPQNMLKRSLFYKSECHPSPLTRWQA